MNVSIFSYLLCTLYSLIVVLAKLNLALKEHSRALRRELLALASASIYQSVKSDLWESSGSKRYRGHKNFEQVKQVL